MCWISLQVIASSCYLQVRSVDAGSVSVEITFQVTFIKSTYMKYIIDRSTNFEMTKWLEALFAHLKKVGC